MKYYRVDIEFTQLNDSLNPTLLAPPPPPFETLEEAENYAALCRQNNPGIDYKIVEISEIE